MKLTKRIISFLLSLVLLVSLACTGAWTPHVHAEEEKLPLNDLQIVHINPLYEGTVTEDDLVEPERPSLYADNTDGEYYYDVESAGELIRDDLVARDTTITVDAYCPYSSKDTLSQDAEALVYDVLSAAMVHTGNPVEGDYLLWQYTGFEAKLQNAKYNDTHIYATITYTMTYHSSAAQEAEVDAAVDKVLTQLNVSGSSSYLKLKAIYDYITSNVTYDHANLNNDSYKLKHTAYAALINKTAVCQGYALLLYRLALELGVDCRLIAGTGNDDDHGWNIAKIDNYYYNLDSTWDAGRTEYQYFLVSPRNFTDHTRWDEYNTADFHVAYPMAEYNYTINCTHNYEAVMTTEPTCESKGVKTYTCSKCGDSYTEAVPSIGHNYDKSVVTAPTCTDKGYTTHTCSACGDSYQDTLVAAIGHSYDNGEITKAPTCAEVGIKTFTCANCKNTYTEELPKLDHVYDKTEVTAPTCTEQGYTTHTCTACGDTYQDSLVAATGHSYDEGVINKDATCTEPGVKTFTCTVCKTSYTEAIPVTDHVYDKVVVTAPTCTQQGYTTHTCTCGDTYQDSFVDATGHSYGNAVITQVATCTDSGIKTYTCSKCGDSIKESIEALGHAYDGGEVTVEPTCTENGIRVHTCARCEGVIKALIDPLGHVYDEGVVTTDPTCTQDGVKTFTCTRNCGSTTTEPVPALGHTPDAGTVTLAPTCLETGIMTYTCTVCEESFTDVIPLGDHDYQNGVCSVCGDIVLLAPKILSCYSNVQTSVKVTWTPVNGADGYQIWRTTTPENEESWETIKTIKDGATDYYTNKNLTKGVTYYYAVRAYMEDEAGQKVYSAFSEMSYMPAAVVWNAPYSNSTFRIRLRWNEIDGAIGYQIWRQDEGGEWKVAKTIGYKNKDVNDDQGATTAYSNVSLKSGARYTYKMRAFRVNDEGKKLYGAFSDEFTVAVLPEAPVITATSPKAGRATIEWNEIYGANKYQVWMRDPADGEWVVIKSITDGSTSFTKYSLESGKTYQFKVRASVTEGGKTDFGAYSEIVAIAVK